MSPVGFVYLVTNTRNGKKYVGCTRQTIKARWAKHCTTAKAGSRFAIHAAIRKYGAACFTVESLEVVEGGHVELMEAERRHISIQNCVAPAGYNLTRGGDGVDHTVPYVLQKHRLANHKLYADPNWQKATVEGARRRSANPDWVRNTTLANRSKAQDSAWLASVSEGVRHKWEADPTYRQKHAGGMLRRSDSPTWKVNVTEAAQRRALDPVWRKANEACLAQAHIVSSAKARARDASLPPKDRERRARRRELDRLRKAAKRAMPRIPQAFAG